MHLLTHFLCAINGKECENTGVNVELDSLDIALLAELQKDARTPQATIGSLIGLSSTAVNRRIRRLTETGVIQRTTAVLAQELLGSPLTIVVNIEAVSEQLDLIDQMEATFASNPSIQQCYYVTGEWDFVLVALVKDMEAYDRLTRELFFPNNNVKRFKSLVVMRRTKVSLDVNL